MILYDHWSPIGRLLVMVEASSEKMADFMMDGVFFYDYGPFPGPSDKFSCYLVMDGLKRKSVEVKLIYQINLNLLHRILLCLWFW